MRAHPDDSDFWDSIDLRLPFGVGPSSRPKPRRVIAHHLILTGYGHWLPNDIRGSGSVELKQEKLEELGPIHHGRKRVQPSRKELREFYAKADPLLQFESLWFDHAKRQALGEAFSKVIEHRYTVWACAILRNHVHFCLRAHRDSAEIMWSRFTDVGRKVIRHFSGVHPDHEVWTRAPYVVFLYTPDDVWDRIDYINDNPRKEGLPQQNWAFVQSYNGWPLHQSSK